MICGKTKGLVVALAACVCLPTWASGVTLPDTDCSEPTVNPSNPLEYAAGVGAPSGLGPDQWVNPPHAYTTSAPRFLQAADACTNYGGSNSPRRFSGELGYALGGGLLFARAGPATTGAVTGGSGTEGCFGAHAATAGHHGAHTWISVRDDTFGGAVTFVVAADWNRSTADPFLPSSNHGGDLDCGDALIEPCDPADPSDYTTPPGCNPFDQDIVVLGANADLNRFDVSTGASSGGTIPQVPSTSSDWAAYAGANGAVYVYVVSSAGPRTTGAIWTE